MTTLAKRSNKQIYRDGDKLVKVFDESFSKADVLNEALNLARIEETDINTPELLNVEKLEGGWAIITTFIEGKTLEELMEENPDKEDEWFLESKVPRMGMKAKPSLYDVMYGEDIQNLINLEDYLQLTLATPSATKLWRERIAFYRQFYQKLQNQLNSSKEIL